MTAPDTDTETLLLRAADADRSAVDALLEKHRDRLRRMVAVHMDRRVAVRLDPSDIVQDALAEAAGKLVEYAREQPIPFYPWLRRMAWERLIQLNRRHIDAQRRSVRREETQAPQLPDHSAVELAGILAANHTGPADRAIREELLARIQAALEALDDGDREILVMRYLEQMSNKEMASLLGITPGSVSMRHLRAIERLRAILGPDFEQEK